MTIEIKSYPIDHLTLRGDDDNDALILKNHVFSYKMLNVRIAALAFWLAEQGLNVGDRVATWAGKSLLSVIMPLAAPRAGLIHVPINPLLKSSQTQYIMDDSGAKLLIANSARLNSLNSETPIATYLRFDEKQIVDLLDQNIIADHGQLPPSEAEPNDLAAILYTSGSTGRPKGVMLSHRNLWLGAVSVSQYLKLGADDRTLALLPLSFDYGQNQLLSAWYSGGAVIPLDYLTPKDVVKSCAKYNITTLAAVPPLWVQLCEYDWGDSAKSIRRITNSGGALTQNLVTDLRSIFGAPATGGADIYAMYGLTEAFRSTYLEPDLIDDNPLSMGRAIPFAEIMVVNKEGHQAGAGEHGELVHAGPLVARGYWRDTLRSGERFKPAPYFSQYADCDDYQNIAVWSGDTVYRGDDGLLYFVGREDAMIKTSGNRVSPGEIEEVAIATGLAVEACALGQKDDRLGAVIILFVRAHHDAIGSQKDELVDALKLELPMFMNPKHIIWLDNFPKNANGKIDRNNLAERLAAGMFDPQFNEAL